MRDGLLYVAIHHSGEMNVRKIEMNPIGIIHSPYKKLEDIPIQGAFNEDTEAWVEINAMYKEGLRDLEGFSHAFFIYYFHKCKHENTYCMPFLEDVGHGIFAIRGPNRPNRIGLTIVKIVRIEENRVYFTNVDVLDGTPLLDIKPYVEFFDARENTLSGWVGKHFKDKVPDRVYRKQ